VAALLILSALAQQKAGPDPHATGKIVAGNADEVTFCTKCHTSGCTMPHPERVAVTWATDGPTYLANGKVTCGSCHSQGFRHRGDAFLARDQKGLCSNCHFGSHAIQSAHPYNTPCVSCHTASPADLKAGRNTAAMVAEINAECLRCHYDGPVSHPVGIPNTKNKCDLPLAKDGSITCVTCHVGHSNQNRFGQLLRSTNRRGALCLKCHDDL
jgi:predicted CXXCH cytochrome family protein